MHPNETTDNNSLPESVLERVLAICSQLAVDYFIECIRHNKQRIVFNALLCEGFKDDEANEFIETIEKFIIGDIEKINRVKHMLELNDNEIVELAQTIFRVHKIHAK